nr:hypothetical protein [Patescibacteria group bacterium]
MVVFDEEKQDKKLSELRIAQEESLAHSLARSFGVSYIDLTTAAINSDALRLVTEDAARTANIAVFDIVGKKIKVGALAPQSEKTSTTIKKLVSDGYIPTIYMVSIESLKKVWSRYTDLSFSLETKGGALDISGEKIASFLSEVKSLEDVKNLIDTTITQKKDYKISGLLEIILAGALALGASDIHVEPEENFVRIRYRLDGVLSDILHFDNDIF